VATVDQTGKVTALKAGTTTITATTEDGGETAACNVTVTQPITGISLNKSKLVLPVGSVEKLEASVMPTDADISELTWESSRSTIATVDSSGNVTAINPGEAFIRIKNKTGDISAFCIVTVIQPVTGVEIGYGASEAFAGETINFGGHVLPDNATNKNITWKSSDESIATIDNTGNVKTLKPGIVWFTVTSEDGHYTSSSKLIVKAQDPTPTPTPTPTVEKQEMYRLYNPNSGEHFYTKNVNEKNYLSSIGWNYEGIGWTAPASSNTPVYRLYNPNAGDHHYTMNGAEKDNLVSSGWNYEGIGWYSDDNKTVPLYRQYNPNASTGTHNYTTSKSENDHLADVGWRPEGIGWYGM
jgi:uncharacterized protein YjdB